jgi:two-component system chemotaxis response regulator CheY
MRLNIMMIDDSPVMRIFIRRVIDLTGLHMGGYCEAGGGEEALTSLHERWIDLILTGINLLRVNGEEFVRRVGVPA